MFPSCPATTWNFTAWSVGTLCSTLSCPVSRWDVNIFLLAHFYTALTCPVARWNVTRSLVGTRLYRHIVLLHVVMIKPWIVPRAAVRNDRNKKRKQKPESTSSLTEELTEDDQMLIQEVLEAHRVTTPNIENGVSGSPPTGQPSVSTTNKTLCLTLQGLVG